MESELRIVDLGEAAALMTIGYKLLRLEQSRRGNHKIFIFELLGDQDAKATIDNYKNHNLGVDAYSFFLNEKELKSRIHDMNETGQ